MRGFESTDYRSVVELDIDTQVQSVADVQLRAGTFSWQERPLTRTAIKHHDLAHYLTEKPVPWDQALVESIDQRVHGFAAYAFNAWNQRLVLLHMHVDAATRGQGIGRTLLGATIHDAAAYQAQHI